MSNKIRSRPLALIPCYYALTNCTQKTKLMGKGEQFTYTSTVTAQVAAVTPFWKTFIATLQVSYAILQYQCHRPRGISGILSHSFVDCIWTRPPARDLDLVGVEELSRHRANEAGIYLTGDKAKPIQTRCHLICAHLVYKYKGALFH
jgi:hypothetical protein